MARKIEKHHIEAFLLKKIKNFFTKLQYNNIPGALSKEISEFETIFAYLAKKTTQQENVSKNLKESIIQGVKTGSEAISNVQEKINFGGALIGVVAGSPFAAVGALARGVARGAVVDGVGGFEKRTEDVKNLLQELNQANNIPVAPGPVAPGPVAPGPVAPANSDITTDQYWDGKTADKFYAGTVGFGGAIVGGLTGILTGAAGGILKPIAGIAGGIGNAISVISAPVVNFFKNRPLIDKFKNILQDLKSGNVLDEKFFSKNKNGKDFDWMINAIDSDIRNEQNSFSLKDSVDDSEILGLLNPEDRENLLSLSLNKDYDLIYEKLALSNTNLNKEERESELADYIKKHPILMRLNLSDKSNKSIIYNTIDQDYDKILKELGYNTTREVKSPKKFNNDGSFSFIENADTSYYNALSLTEFKQLLQDSDINSEEGKQLYLNGNGIGSVNIKKRGDNKFIINGDFIFGSNAYKFSSSGKEEELYKKLIPFYLQKDVIDEQEENFEKFDKKKNEYIKNRYSVGFQVNEANNSLIYNGTVFELPDNFIQKQKTDLKLDIKHQEYIPVLNFLGYNIQILDTESNDGDKAKGNEIIDLITKEINKGDKIDVLIEKKDTDFIESIFSNQYKPFYGNRYKVDIKKNETKYTDIGPFFNIGVKNFNENLKKKEISTQSLVSFYKNVGGFLKKNSEYEIDDNLFFKYNFHGLVVYNKNKEILSYFGVKEPIVAFPDLSNNLITKKEQDLFYIGEWNKFNQYSFKLEEKYRKVDLNELINISYKDFDFMQKNKGLTFGDLVGRGQEILDNKKSLLNNLFGGAKNKDDLLYYFQDKIKNFFNKEKINFSADDGFENLYLFDNLTDQQIEALKKNLTLVNQEETVKKIKKIVKSIDDLSISSKEFKNSSLIDIENGNVILNHEEAFYFDNNGRLFFSGDNLSKFLNNFIADLDTIVYDKYKKDYIYSYDVFEMIDGKLTRTQVGNNNFIYDIYGVDSNGNKTYIKNSKDSYKLKNYDKVFISCGKKNSGISLFEKEIDIEDLDKPLYFASIGNILGVKKNTQIEQIAKQDIQVEQIAKQDTQVEQIAKQDIQVEQIAKQDTQIEPEVEEETPAVSKKVKKYFSVEKPREEINFQNIEEGFDNRKRRRKVKNKVKNKKSTNDDIVSNNSDLYSNPAKEFIETENIDLAELTASLENELKKNNEEKLDNIDKYFDLKKNNEEIFNLNQELRSRKILKEGNQEKLYGKKENKNITRDLVNSDILRRLQSNKLLLSLKDKNRYLGK